MKIMEKYSNHAYLSLAVINGVGQEECGNIFSQLFEALVIERTPLTVNKQRLRGKG